MNIWRTFWRDKRGSSAAEFALVLPVALLFLIGMTDVGRFMWEYNRAEKATQIGARWAAATQVMQNGLASYSFAINGSIPQGDPIPASSVPTITCGEISNTFRCDCSNPTCPSGWDTGANLGAFQTLVDRMSQIKPDISYTNTSVVYSPSGVTNDLGYSGNPNGHDAVPLVTIKVTGLQFTPILLFGGTINMPDFSYSLTMEDGSGSVSN